MANDLTTTDRAAQSKAVGAFANSTMWNLTSAMAQADGVDVVAVLAGYERGLMPLAEAEPKGRSLRDPSAAGALTTLLGDDLAMLATKIAPTLATDQADAWIKVMCVALSDLPGRVAREAATAALHRPMKFLNEVESVIRDEAAAITVRHSVALRRLKQMADAIARASMPSTTLPDDDVSTGPMPLARIRALSRLEGWPAFKKIGLSTGSFTEDEIDAALSEPVEQAQAA
ncbi:hypothetical protein [Sphingomonas sp. TREG-RG-20F-R18-01]|uniref:hypothetical protein n=1 Tax=Sphingomonas sp. TREG-RG-20F-R18-01 TaxID=2914982 RepID=UPI001F580BCB|nr:hypothetical protein [Sphingomonas sp. TREG-RG-20F-R18-01]